MLQISFYSNHLETILHLKKHLLCWSSTGTHLNCYVCLINAKLSLIPFTLLGGEFLKFWCLAVKRSVANHIPDGSVQTLLQRTLIMYCSLFTFNKLQSWKKAFCIKTYKLIWCLRSLSIRLTTMPEIKHNTWHVTLFHNLFSKNIAKRQGVCRFSHIASHCFHRDKKGK